MSVQLDTSVMLKYVNTVFDMKRAISCETGIPITDFYLLNGVHVVHDDDTLLKSRVRPRVGLQLCIRLRGGNPTLSDDESTVGGDP